MGLLRETAQRIKVEFAVYRLALRHPGTPWLAKVLLGLAVAYMLLPFDLIPDFIPVIGHLDDLVIVPVLVLFALKLIPAQVMSDCRKQLDVKNG